MTETRAETAVINWLQEHSPVVAFDGNRCRLEWWVSEQRYRAEGSNLRDAVRNAMGYEPDPPAEYRAIQDSGVPAIRGWLGGEGDLLTDQQIEDAWQAFSTDFCASWLIVDHHTVGNFAGWLLNKAVSRNDFPAPPPTPEPSP